MFTHSHCGGTLLPIEDGPPFKYRHFYADDETTWCRPSHKFHAARCDRCGRAGELLMSDVQDLYRGLVRK